MAPTAKADQIKVTFCPDGSVSGGWHSSSAPSNGGVTASGGCWNGYQNVPGGGGGGAAGAPGGGSGAVGGGGSAQTSASTTTPVDKKNSKAPPCLRVGDPIDPGSGTKVDMETDFAMPGEMGLRFQRFYMSRGIHGTGGGPGWSDGLDYEMHSICLGTGSPTCTTATFMRPDGSQLDFQQPSAAATGAFLAGPFTEVGGGGLAKLTFASNGAGGGTYAVIDEDGMTYTWATDMTTGTFPSNKGILTAIKDASGIGWTLSYPDGNTVLVTHTSGQQMTVAVARGTHGGVNSLTVTDPGGNQYVYQAASPDSFTWNLMPLVLGSVSFPGSNPLTIQYKYSVFDPSSGHNFPSGLSEVDYNGVAHDLTTYDTNGNALSTSLADDTQKTSLVYGSNSTGAVINITNPLGHVAVYQYNASNLPTSVTGQASAHCAATLSQMTYDTNGNMQSKVDNNGNTTTYNYSSTGQLLQTVAAAGTAIARTTNYVWDSTPGADRLLSVTVAGWSQTAYTYNAQNRMTSVSVKNLSPNGVPNQTLTTSYGYTLYANGMVQTMTVTHPSSSGSDVESYHYDALGNLTSYTDGLGHGTTYSNYNALGEPGRIVGSNGNTADFTYDGRGLLLTKTTYPNGTAAQWSYSYDQFGLVSSESAPDGEITTWNRNASGVLQTVVHNDKDGTSTETFGYNANGDITSDTVTRGGVVSLSTQASYDELGRPYLKQGMHGQTISYTYDGNSNVQSITNAMGHVKSYAYDALDRPASVTDSGGASPSIPVTAPSLTVPSNNNNGAYAVSWTGVSGATAYLLQQQVNGGGWQTVQYMTATSWNATGKNNGTYDYRVQACNSSGCSPWSATASVVVALAPTSAPSLGAPGSSSNGAYAVSWNSVATATTYALQEQVNGGAWTTIQSGSATSASISGRASGAYGYRAQACNGNGCGPWGAVVSVTVLFPPQSAPVLSVPSSTTTGAYTVSWATVSLAASYTLQEQVNGGGWSTIQTSGATSWATSGRPNANYGYRVQACNASGCGAWSGTSTIAVTVGPQTAPTLSAPASASSGSYTLNWTAVNYATSYSVQERSNGGAWVAAYTGSALSLGISGKVAGSYDYIVNACNSYACSGWSAISTVVVSVPIAINGQSYQGLTIIPTGGTADARIGVRIATGNTWQIYNENLKLRGGTLASGAIPAAAVTVQYTWTFTGVPSGYIDGLGSVGNGASSPTSVSSNPSSEYVTVARSGLATVLGRTYSVRVDFFNAVGVNISSSTCTLTALLEGSP
jgi:YD repeat-containing protein